MAFEVAFLPDLPENSASSESSPSKYCTAALAFVLEGRVALIRFFESSAFDPFRATGGGDGEAGLTSDLENWLCSYS